MTQPPCIEPSVLFSLDSCSTLSAASCFQSANYQFSYAFDSGHRLVGFVKGDRDALSSRAVCNLRGLSATCLDPEGSPRLRFDTVFGQFDTRSPEVVLLGAHAVQGSFFSLNHRGGDASIYDAVTDTWVTSVTSGWNPARWTISEIPHYRYRSPQPAVPPVLNSLWTNVQLIA